MSSALTNSNRVNVPAVCRLAYADDDRITVGSGVLVGDGLILTARSIFDKDKTNSITTTAEATIQASRIKAIFFEGTKKKAIVHVSLLPSRCFIRGLYPSYMDYCIIAVDNTHLLNVIPVHIPLIRREWPSVEEGDTILVIEHPINVTALTVVETKEADNACLNETNSKTNNKANNNNNSKRESGAKLTDCSNSNSQGHNFENSGNNNSSPEKTEELPLLELKCFEEIVRKRDDTFQLRANGNLYTAGCPAFNDEGALIGVQGQTRIDNEGVMSKVISIVAIVQHLFANNELHILPQRSLSAEEVWQTWFTVHDVARAMSILTNFTGDHMARVVMEQLCLLAISATRTMTSDITATSEEHAKHINDIVMCGGMEVMLRYMLRFISDATFIHRSLRALWSITTGNEFHLERLTLSGGVETILVAMQAFPSHEEVQHYGLVLLDNIAYGTFGAVAFDPHSTRSSKLENGNLENCTLHNKSHEESELEGQCNISCRGECHDSTGLDAIRTTCNALLMFNNDVLIQKFGVHLLSFLIDQATCNEESRIVYLLEHNIVEHACNLLQTFRHNNYVMEVIMPFLSKLVSFRGTTENFFFEHISTCTETNPSNSNNNNNNNSSSNSNNSSSSNSGDSYTIKQHHGNPCIANQNYDLSINNVSNTIKKLIELVIQIMQECKDNITVMLHGNRLLWVLGQDITCRIYILEHEHGCDVLQRSVYALKRGQESVSK